MSAPTYLNSTKIPLSVAVYLATDHYDYVPDAISATGLMKPVRQAILQGRVPKAQRQTELVGLSKSRMGTSIHDGIEKAWDGGHYKQAMRQMGYPQSVIDRIVVNPERDLTPEDIPVYMEKRAFRNINGKTVSGKFDFVAEGRLEDFKSTSTFTWVQGTKDEDYPLQGSIYKWLNPKIITQDHMAIQFFFWDWMAARAKDPKYPDHPVMQKTYKLYSEADTEQYIVNKLNLFEKYATTPEPEIPLCTDKELWRKAPAWKYYKSGKVGPRSTKNFDNPTDAHNLLVEHGSTGVVIEKLGEVVACKYCPAFDVCTQKDTLIADGSLVL